MKTHLTIGCGRGVRKTTNVYDVTCDLCKRSVAYQVAKEAADAVKQEKFLAQVPRAFAEPWKRGENVKCKSCGNDQFRQGDRSCYGHYDNFYCAACGNVESRLTETGMSF